MIRAKRWSSDCVASDLCRHDFFFFSLSNLSDVMPFELTKSHPFPQLLFPQQIMNS